MTENCFLFFCNDGIQEEYRQGSTKIWKWLKNIFVIAEYKRGIDKDQ